MSTNIELSKTRDFGEIISDTFLFIRENLVPLLKCFFIFCGFFMIASLILSYLQQAKVIGVMNDFKPINPDSYNSGEGTFRVFSKFFGVQYFLSFLFLFLDWTAVVITVISYMAVYKTKGNIAATPEEVWAYVKYYFLKTSGSLLLVGMLLGIATVCCVIPGIYLYPILLLIFPIMIIENASFGYAFSQSFRLIKENWWATFGAMFVIGLIVYVLILIIVLPVSLITMGGMFLHPAKGLHVSPVLLMISTIIYTLAQVFYILPLVTLTLCYFNLTELKDATGLMSRINQLGNDGDNTNLPAEEY